MPIEYTEGSTDASKYLFQNQSFTLKYFLKISYIFTSILFISIYNCLPPTPLVFPTFPPSQVHGFLFKEKKTQKLVCVCVCVVNV